MKKEGCGPAGAGCPLVALSLTLSYLFLSLLRGLECLQVELAGCREPPLLALMFPLHGSLPRPSSGPDAGDPGCSERSSEHRCPRSKPDKVGLEWELTGAVRKFQSCWHSRHRSQPHSVVALNL